MRAYTTTTHDNFTHHERLDVNDYKLEDYADILPFFRHLNTMFGTTTPEILAAVGQLHVANEEVIEVDYQQPHDSLYAKLLKPNAAERSERDKYGNYHNVYYSAYVVPHSFSCYQSRLIRHFLEKRYPEIFLHPAFFREVCQTKPTDDMALSQVVGEFGEMTIRQARHGLPLHSTRQYPQSISKFNIYDLLYSDPMDYELYLTTDGESLYVPLRAITQRDFSLIEQRQRNYWTEYYRSKPDKRDEALIALQSPEALLMKELLTATTMAM